jgi:hypothetical protein
MVMAHLRSTRTKLIGSSGRGWVVSEGSSSASFRVIQLAHGLIVFWEWW